MVRCHMYCAEQIVIPDTLPNILKTYAKAAIRTQPYDLLRWSAAYFRCLAINVPPPVKPRLEKDSNFGCLTKGYLRVLLAQVGKGYFIRRDVLQKRWEGLCLPEEELFKFLSLCRMFNWTQIHWLKLFAVMVGSLSINIKETTVTICELLTEENDGGSAPVPIWMFRECYSFIANMDCSVEQKFKNGRKILSNGELEEQKPIPLGPKILSSMAFRDAVLEEWKKYLEDNEHNVDMNNSIHDSCFDLSRDSEMVSEASERASRISSTFMFVGDYQDAHEVIRKSPDFDSIILLLHEAQSENLRKYDGPAFNTEKNLNHAKTRELEILEKHDQISQAYENQVVEYLYAERINLLKEIGPPWSWLYQFASQNCRDKSYNFVEDQLVSSDITPAESSDESFDLEQQKLDSPKKKEYQLKFSNSSEVLKSLHDSNEGKSTPNDFDLESIMKTLKQAVDSGEIFVENTPSIVNYLKKVEKEDSKNQIPEFVYGSLKEFLIAAEKNSLIFKDLNELFQYFKEQIGKQVPSINDSNISDAKHDMKEIFKESGIDVDNKELAIETSNNMILGLSNEKPEILNKTKLVKEPEEKKSFWADKSNGSELAKVSVNLDKRSKKQNKTKITEEMVFIDPVEPFTCIIPPLLGIGKAVSDKTIQDFVTFLKYRSREQKGLIFPRTFREDQCPNMIDPL